MKTYGVNWFLVWIGLLILFCPIYLWAENVLLLPWPHVVAHLQPPLLAQALGQSLCWTWIYYYVYGKALADPKVTERARQNYKRIVAARHRRFHWPVTWVTVIAIVAALSVTCKLIFGGASWLHVIGYSLLMPSSCFVGFWLVDKAADKGPLIQLLRKEEAP